MHNKMAVFPMLQIFMATVVILSLILRSRSCTLSPRAFAFEPSDKLAFKGEFVNFTCIVHEFDPLSDFIVWEVDPDDNNTNVMERYYEQSSDALSIITVQASKSIQYFTCMRVYSKHNLCFSSRRATLKVQFTRHFPHKGNLECGPHHPEAFQDGDIIHAFCTVPRGNPPVDMSWRLHPSVPTFRLPPAYHDDAFKRVLTHAFPITQELHMKTIVCEVTSEIVFPGCRLQCLIGPILVNRPPTVLVQPINHEVSHGLFVEFTCVAHGYPDQFHLSWSCIPDGVLSGCESMSETANISLSRYVDLSELNDVRVVVECTASNGIDRGMGFAQVEILPSNIIDPTLSTTTVKITSCPKDILVNVTIHVQSDSGPDNKEMTISCSIPQNITQQEIQLHWYIGDHKIQQDIPNVIIKETSPELSYLHVLHLPLEDVNKSISCVADSKFCNVTYTSFVNLGDSLEEQPNRTEELSTLYSQSNITYPRNINHTVQASTSNRVLSGNPSQGIHENSFHPTSLPYHQEYTSDLSNSPQSNYEVRNYGGWQTITFALLGSLGIVIIVSCIVAAISVTMYRQLKKDNLKNMNSLRKELKTDGRISRSDFRSDLEHVYEDAQIEPPIKLNNRNFPPNTSHDLPVFMNQNCMHDSPSDNYSYYTSSAGSSWSNSSGVYLDPNPAINSLNRHLDFESDVHVQNIYGNDKVIQMQMDKASGCCRAPSATRSIIRHQPSQEGSEIPMPPLPLKRNTSYNDV